MRIVIRADASPALGMGHVYRALALEHEFAALGHEVTLTTRSEGEYALGYDFLSGRSENVAGPSMRRAASFDVAIQDTLGMGDADVWYSQQCGTFIITLEDFGGGAEGADLTINALYAEPEHAWTGPRNAILAQCFEDAEPIEVREKVERIILAFGGTDPGSLTSRALAAVYESDFAGRLDIVLGPGCTYGVKSRVGRIDVAVHRDVRDMAALMGCADLAITSAGRTVTELMSLGVPTIALCQNTRELTHTHASGHYGVLNLGLGEHVTVAGLRHHIDAMLDVGIRRMMHERMLAALRGRTNRGIVERILAAVEEG